MKVYELLETLKDIPLDTNFGYAFSLFESEYEVTIDYVWGSKKISKLKEIIEKLSTYNKDYNVTIDIEDGYTYAVVIGVRYENNTLTFIDACYK